MMKSNSQIPDEGLSFKDLYGRLVTLINHLIANWKQILIGSIVIFTAYVSYSLLRKPVYTAETTFVLESGGVEMGGSLGSIASLAGVDLSAMTGGSPLFQSENIIELYRSREMLREVFLTSCDFNGQSELLIDRYARFTKLRKRWDSNARTAGIDFNVPREEFSVTHDSLLFEVIKVFRERHLVVERPSRQLSILSVRIAHKDQQFAMRFNETLVKRVNGFYLSVKTRKTAENVRVLQQQADSVKEVMNDQLVAWSESLESQPNVNSLLKTPFIESMKLEIDVKTSSAAYQQLVTNLEMAKLNHRNNTPLIQIIDRPQLPLPNDKMRLFKLLVFAAVMSSTLSVVFFIGRYIFRNAIAR